jgi:hypothetical protein
LPLSTRLTSYLDVADPSVPHQIGSYLEKEQINNRNRWT